MPGSWSSSIQATFGGHANLKH